MIECGKFLHFESTILEKYNEILDVLWKTVCTRLFMETLSRLSSGEKIQYENTIVDKNGITLIQKKLFGNDVPIYSDWKDLTLLSADGMFQIQSTTNKKAKARLSYRDYDNIHILESVMRFLWKDGNYKRLMNGEFK